MTEDLENVINKWVQGIIKEYKPIYHKKKKIIKDPIWNMIELSELECTLLDAPFIQRLRRIHQTGLAYLTYPAAVHTRFEHTIGVVAATTKIAQRLKFAHELRGLSICEEDLQELRLAAILHDVGHCALSHLSEPHLETHMLFKAYAEKFKKRTGLTVKPHELLGHCIVNSPSFVDFFNDLMKGTAGTHKLTNATEALTRVGDMIVGFSPNGEKSRLYLSNIINGAFDADKIDYIARDSYFTGIALGAEAEMLMHKLFVYPTEIFDGLTGKDVTANCIIVDYSGGVAFEQIAMSKKSLNVNVYNHQKVMAAHELGRDLIHMVIKGKINVHGIKFNDPSLFLNITDWDLLSGSTDSLEGQILQKRLAGRILPRRALKIAEHTLDPEASGTLINFFAKINEDLQHGKNDFRQAVAELSGVDSSEIFLAIPKVPTTRELMEGKCKFPDGEIEDIGNHFAGAVESYGIRREISYIYAFPPNISKVANAAMEVLSSEIYGSLKFNDRATAGC